MNGAESLVRTLVDAGVEVCFTNPGTSEMHMVAAVDKVPGMRAVLGLFEGVVTGAADGYGRMAGKPACTLLHLGPGVGNGLANLHNARRARSPIVNLVGDHATYHMEYDAPLNSDLEGISRTQSAWYASARTAEELPKLGAECVAQAMVGNGQIATLAIPADTAWDEAGGPAAPPERPSLNVPDGQTVSTVAAALRAAKAPMILLGSTGVMEQGLHAAGRIAAATGCALHTETFVKRLQRGAGRVLAAPVPYFGEMAMDALAGKDLMILAGAKEPVAFFAYPEKPSRLVPEGCETLVLALPTDDVVAGLEALATALEAPAEPAHVQPEGRAEMRRDGALDADAIGRAISALMPEEAIVCDEGVTNGIHTFLHTFGAPKHDWLHLTGGAIGQGLPLAAGAAIACPERKVICLHGDGGAMYTVQALWTMAREKLDVTTVIFDNRSYAILNIELARVGAENPGPKALSMLDIGNPDIDWVKLSEAQGVKAFRASTPEDFIAAFETCMKEKGPHLIQAVV